MFIPDQSSKFYRRVISTFIAITFITSVILPPSVSAQVVLNLPMPGAMVNPTAGFTPAIINGIIIHPENPLEFDFIIGNGDQKLEGKAFEDESTRLIKYFMAALTVPEEEMWVNLSPVEKDRIIPQGFGTTEMGRDLLAQDYILKQLTASLMYPEKELGKKFWDKIYQKAKEQFGTTEIPVDTFNKVWIVPEKAVVYEHGNSAFVVKSHLKVMLEQDYVALQHASKMEDGKEKMENGNGKSENQFSLLDSQSSIIKEIIVPEIEKEVNEGQTFAQLRQIYNSAILAAWFKQNLKKSLLGQLYVDQYITKGIETDDKQINQKIYNQYLEAFKKGVYNYIKEDTDLVTQEIIPRKYFSGGTSLKVRDLLEMYKEGTLTDRAHQEVLAEYISRFKKYTGGGQKQVNVELAELSPKMTVEEAQDLIAAAREKSEWRWGVGKKVTTEISVKNGRIVGQENFDDNFQIFKIDSNKEKEYSSKNLIFKKRVGREGVENFTGELSFGGGLPLVPGGASKISKSKDDINTTLIIWAGDSKSPKKLRLKELTIRRKGWEAVRQINSIQLIEDDLYHWVRRLPEGVALDRLVGTKKDGTQDWEETEGKFTAYNSKWNLATFFYQFTEVYVAGNGTLTFSPSQNIKEGGRQAFDRYRLVTSKKNTAASPVVVARDRFVETVEADINNLKLTFGEDIDFIQVWFADDPTGEDMISVKAWDQGFPKTVKDLMQIIETRENQMKKTETVRLNFSTSGQSKATEANKKNTVNLSYKVSDMARPSEAASPVNSAQAAVDFLNTLNNKDLDLIIDQFGNDKNGNKRLDWRREINRAIALRVLSVKVDAAMVKDKEFDKYSPGVGGYTRINNNAKTMAFFYYTSKETLDNSRITTPTWRSEVEFFIAVRKGSKVTAQKVLEFAMINMGQTMLAQNKLAPHRIIDWAIYEKINEIKKSNKLSSSPIESDWTAKELKETVEKMKKEWDAASNKGKEFRDWWKETKYSLRTSALPQGFSTSVYFYDGNTNKKFSVKLDGDWSVTPYFNILGKTIEILESKEREEQEGARWRGFSLAQISEEFAKLSFDEQLEVYRKYFGVSNLSGAQINWLNIIVNDSHKEFKKQTIPVSILAKSAYLYSNANAIRYFKKLIQLAFVDGNRAMYELIEYAATIDVEIVHDGIISDIVKDVVNIHNALGPNRKSIVSAMDFLGNVRSVDPLLNILANSYLNNSMYSSRIHVAGLWIRGQALRELVKLKEEGVDIKDTKNKIVDYVHDIYKNVFVMYEWGGDLFGVRPYWGDVKKYIQAVGDINTINALYELVPKVEKIAGEKAVSRVKGLIEIINTNSSNQTSSAVGEQQIFEKVKDVLQKHFGKAGIHDEIHRKSLLVKDFASDSMDFMELYFEIGKAFQEEPFKIEISDEDWETVKKDEDIKVEDIVNLVLSLSSSPMVEMGISPQLATSNKKEVGGINLDPKLLDLQIKRDGNGVPLPLPMQPIKDMHIEGFIPIIINVTPVTNLPLLLGLSDTTEPARVPSSAASPGLGPIDRREAALL